MNIEDPISRIPPHIFYQQQDRDDSEPFSDDLFCSYKLTTGL